MTAILGIGDFGLGALVQRAEQARNESDQIKQDVLDALAEAQSLVGGDRVFNQELLDQFRRQAYPTLGPDWHQVASNATGTGSANTSTKSITIDSGTTGVGTGLSQTINLASFGYKAGEKVVIRLLLLESTFAAINESLVVRVFRGASEVAVYYEAEVFATMTLNIDIPYTVLSVLGETLTIRLEVATGAPEVPSTRTIKWSGLLISNEKERFATLYSRMAQSMRQATEMYATFEKSSTVYKGDLYGQVDETERITEEINTAIDKNGVYLFPKNAGVIVSGSIPVNGHVQVIGSGKTTAFLTRFSGPLFAGQTDQPIILKNFRFGRYDPSQSPNLIKFSPDFINKDSLIESVQCDSVPNPVILDYCDRLTLRKMEFLSGQTAVQAGTIAPLSTTNMTIEYCICNSVHLTALEYQGTGSVAINRNEFYKAPASQAEVRRNIVVAMTYGDNKLVEIYKNKSFAFREHMIRVAIQGPPGQPFTESAKLEGLEIYGNYAEDLTDSGFSAPIRITSLFGFQQDNPLDTVDIMRNILHNKVRGIEVIGASNLRLKDNTITKHDRSNSSSFADSKAFYLEDIWNLSSHGNFKIAQKNDDTLTNCSLNGSGVFLIN